MQKITPTLWINNNADEAVRFYLDIFGGNITHTAHYTPSSEEITGKKAGEVMYHEFEILGYRLAAINGGGEFTPTPAISLMVNCRDEDEFDALWKQLSADGEVLMAAEKYPFSPKYGWCNDKYGVSWQVITSPDMKEQEIVPTFMFTQGNWGKTEEAMSFYVGVFAEKGGESKVGEIAHYGDIMPDGSDMPAPEGAAGKVMFANFWLAGQKFSAMDSTTSEHGFTFTPGLSLLVDAKDQTEMDYFSDTLSVVPEAEMCGWLQDKYGVSWQVSNRELEHMLQSGDAEAIDRANKAMMNMKRLNLAELERAYKGE